MSSSKSTTVRMQRYYKVTKTSSTPLRPEDIQVEINQSDTNQPGNSREPNFLALSVLWAHYQAYQQGILTEKGPSPWEIVGSEALEDEYSKAWLRFLQQVIIDKEWVKWIQDPAEVKRRVLAVLDESHSHHADQEVDPMD